MENIVIWGTGIISGFITRLIHEKKISNLNIVCYVETEPGRKEFEGLKVFPASELSGMEYSKVLVASTFVKEIRNWIVENNISETDICYAAERKIAIAGNDGWEVNFEDDDPKEWISFMKNVLFTNSIEFIESVSEIGKDFSKYWNVEGLYKVENISSSLKKNQEDMLYSSFIPHLKPTDILCDMACAWGFYSEMLAKYVKHIDAVDYSEYQISVARENSEKKGISNIEYYAADAREYCFDKEYDAFVMMSLLLNIQNDAEVVEILEKVYRAMSPGGYVFVKDSLTKMEESKVYGFDLRDSYTGCYRNMGDYEKMYTDMGFKIIEKRILADDFYTGVVEKPSVGYLMKKEH